MADRAQQDRVVAVDDLDRVVGHRLAGAQQPLASPIELGHLQRAAVPGHRVDDRPAADASTTSGPIPSPPIAATRSVRRPSEPVTE